MLKSGSGCGLSVRGMVADCPVDAVKRTARELGCRLEELRKRGKGSHRVFRVVPPQGAPFTISVPIHRPRLGYPSDTCAKRLRRRLTHVQAVGHCR